MKGEVRFTGSIETMLKSKKAKKMICVTVSCFNHYSTRMRQINESFRNLGYDVVYLTTDFNHFDKKRYSVEYEGAIQLHVPSYSRNISPARLISHAVFSQKVYQELCRIAPDVIYCMFPPNSLVKQIDKYKNNHKTKVILDCYDMWPESFPQGNLRADSFLPFRKWRNLRDDHINCADLLLCVSDSGKKALEGIICEDRIRVLQPVVEQAKCNVWNCDVETSLSFCYMGNINHIIDTQVAIELLGGLAKHIPVTLHLIGGGESINVFCEDLERTGVKVVRYGVVFDREEKLRIFALCNYGLNIPKAQIHSTMALKSVEYMSAALPLINSSLGSTAEIIKEHGIGINISAAITNSDIEAILNTTEEENRAMREKCVEYYADHFVAQDISALLATVIE